MKFVNTMALVFLALARRADAAQNCANVRIWVANCEDEPCVHGSCAADATSYTCTCDAGFTGANCDARSEPFSRYPLDGDFIDTAPAGNSLASTFTPADDSVCGGSLRVEAKEFFAFRNPNGVPTGSESWTLSIYAKMVKSPRNGLRAFMNLGGDGGKGIKGFWFGYRKQQLFAKFAGNTGIFLDSEWHHYAATSNGSTVKVYFDEREVASVDGVALDLVEWSKYSTMMIGESHFRGKKYARAGVWLFDEVVFGRGVLGFDVLRAPCLPIPTAAPPTDDAPVDAPADVPNIDGSTTAPTVDAPIESF
ncbi:hypothetical protein DIPPA_16923 [Diplonema papillatum]|nr:hypothetical protein DIPPA_16923 [Diplonema papillatum]